MTIQEWLLEGGDLEDEVGICMNCGAEMDYSPWHPWCVDCEEDDD